VTWTKLGDEFPDAAWHLSDAAWRTHAEALLWSNRLLLDLVVPKRHLRRFALSDLADQAAAELVATGWWADDGDCWEIGLRFPEWQRDRVQVEHRRAYLAEAQRRSRRHREGDHSLCLPACKARATSSRDSTGESTVDPGRAGSGRAGTGNHHQREEQQDTPAEPGNRVLWSVPDRCEGCGGPLAPEMAAAGIRAHPNCQAAV